MSCEGKLNKPLNLDDMRKSLENDLRSSPIADQRRQEIRELIDQSAKAEEMLAATTQDVLISIGEAAEYLGVSEQTLRNWELSKKLIPQRTKGDHRRYLKSELKDIKKKQLSEGQIVLPKVSFEKLITWGYQLLGNFRRDEMVTLTISSGVVDGKVSIIVDSEDGLTTIRKTFNIKD